MRLGLSIILPICVSTSVLAEPDSSAILNELRTAPQPKRQTDLDPLQLASAHRERAVSVQEKTNGLWQSWLTSVCDGCGNTPSYRSTLDDDFAKRKVAVSRDPGTAAVSQLPPRNRGENVEQYSRRLYTDLSPETVGQIRRMPRQ